MIKKRKGKMKPADLAQKYDRTLENLKREIRDRKAAEAKLKKSEQSYSDLLKQSEVMQENLRHLSHQILLTQEDERKKISRELHDEIAQTLTGIHVHLVSLNAEAAINSKDLKKNIVRTQRLVEKSVAIVHQFARDLRPTLLDDLGLIPALSSYMKEFTKRTDIPIHFTNSSGNDRLDGDKRTVLYRVVQSALTNVSQHAHANRVDVRIQKVRGGISLLVRDNGKSFNLDRVFFNKKRKRLGLIGMRERVEMVGGTFVIDAVPGKGTTIRVQIPFANGSAAGRAR